MQKLFTYSIIFTLFISCQKAEKKVLGYWIIEEATYEGEDIFNVLRYNVLSIESNGTCKTPVIEKKNSFNREAHWYTQKKDGQPYLIINSDIPTWNQEFQISFKTRIQGDAKVPEIYLQSKDMFLKAVRHCLSSESVLITCIVIFFEWLQ